MNLNMEITLPKAFTKKKVHYPEKTTVNLAVQEKNPNSGRYMMIGFAVLILFMAAFLKFGVIDQLTRLHTAESEYADVHTQYATYSAALRDYNDVVMEYRTYATGSDATDEEGNAIILVSRRDILDLIEDKMMTRGEVTGISIEDNTVLVTMSGMTLDEISAMFKDIRSSELVAGATLNMAQTDEESASKDLEFSVTIDVNSPGDDMVVLTPDAGDTAGGETAGEEGVVE